VIDASGRPTTSFPFETRRLVPPQEKLKQRQQAAEERTNKKRNKRQKKKVNAGMRGCGCFFGHSCSC
jgi:hypothetical protein